MEAHVLAATLHASVVATAEACLYEAAIHAIFGGDEAAFTRARPRASWEDYGWARIKCAEASTAVDTASLHEHSLPNRLPLRPEESALAELNALPGTTLQTLSARLAAHGAAAIPEFLLYPTEDDGSTEYAAICRVKATLACIWRRVAGMGTSILAHDALCDQWLARYAVQLSTSPMTIQLAAFYSAPLHRARLQHVAECFSGANNACEIDSCLEAAKEALGAEAVPELACRVCDQFVQKVQKNGALSLSAALTSGNRARNFFALGWLAAVPLELVRHANSILTDLGLSAIMHCDDVFWIDVDAALAYIPNTALDTVVDVACARGPHDVFATALLKIHLGWRTIRLAIRCINTWQDVPLRALAQTTSIDCGPATKSAHQCSTATYDTLVATFAFPMQSSLKASFTPVHIQADCLGADDTKDANIDLQWRIDVLLKTLVGPLVGGFLPKLGWLDLGALQEAASIGKTKIDHSFRVAGTVLIHATDVARTTADALSQRDQPDLAWHWYINCLQLADILAEPEADGAARLAVVRDLEWLFPRSPFFGTPQFLRYALLTSSGPSFESRLLLSSSCAT